MRLSDDEATVLTIRNYFVTLGGNVPMRELATSIIEHHMPEDVISRCRLRGLMKLCQQALKSLTKDNLPFAQPTRPTLRDPLQLDLFDETPNRRVKGEFDKTLSAMSPISPDGKE